MGAEEDGLASTFCSSSSSKQTTSSTGGVGAGAGPGKDNRFFLAVCSPAVGLTSISVDPVDFRFKFRLAFAKFASFVAFCAVMVVVAVGM